MTSSCAMALGAKAANARLANAKPLNRAKLFMRRLPLRPFVSELASSGRKFSYGARNLNLVTSTVKKRHKLCLSCDLDNDRSKAAGPEF